MRAGPPALLVIFALTVALVLIARRLPRERPTNLVDAGVQATG